MNALTIAIPSMDNMLHPYTNDKVPVRISELAMQFSTFLLAEYTVEEFNI